jgi:hypothetical protein
MQRTVWKFPLRGTGEPETVLLPATAKVVSFGVDPATGSRLALWAEVPFLSTEQQRMEERTVVIVGTGHPIPEGNYEHAGMTIVSKFDFHLYVYIR